MTFIGAPVSKALVIGVGATTLLAAASSRQYLFNVPLGLLTRDKQLWRLATHHFVFGNSSELFVGILLLFYTSIHIERVFGSVKYASFLVAVTALSTLFEVFALLIGSRIGFTTIPAGPFAIIFAIIYQSTRIVPSTFHWKVFGFKVTNRVALYVLALQLLTSQPPSSFVVSLIGIATSNLYRSSLALSAFRLSPRFILLATRLFSPLLGTSPPARRSNAASFGEGMESIRLGFPGGLVRGSATPVTRAVRVPVAGPTRVVPAVRQPGLVQQWTEGITGSVQRPTAEQITELSAIFPDVPREGILSALQQSGLDVSRAAEELLAAGS